MKSTKIITVNVCDNTGCPRESATTCQICGCDLCSNHINKIGSPFNLAMMIDGCTKCFLERETIRKNYNIFLESIEERFNAYMQLHHPNVLWSLDVRLNIIKHDANRA